MTSKPAPGTDGYVEYQDEMERRGDSILDEESYMDVGYGYDGWDVVYRYDTVWVRLVPRGEWVGFTPDEARGLANSILSEIEIAQREGDGKW